MPLRTVTGTVLKPDATAWAGATLRFRLVPGSYTGAGEQYPEAEVYATTDALGAFSVALWTNDAGDAASRYVVRMPNAEHITFVLPQGDGTPISLSILRSLGLTLSEPGFDSVLTYLGNNPAYVGSAGLANHLNDVANPHAVTAAQAGAYTTAQVDAAIAAHTGRTDNPHAVTAAQAGAVALAGDTMTGPLVAEVRGPLFDNGGAVRNVRHPSFGAKGDGVADDRAAFVALETAGDHGFIPAGTYLIGTNLTLSKAWTFASGAKIKPAAEVVVTINGPMEAGAWQIFDYSAGGTVKFGPKCAIRDVIPQWFGAQDGSGSAVALAGIQRAIDAVVASSAYDQISGRPLGIYLPWGLYYISATLQITEPIHWSGPGIVTRDAASGITLLVNVETGGSEYKRELNMDIHLYGNPGGAVNVTGIKFKGPRAPSGKATVHVTSCHTGAEVAGNTEHITLDVYAEQCTICLYDHDEGQTPDENSYRVVGHEFTTLFKRTRSVGETGSCVVELLGEGGSGGSATDYAVELGGGGYVGLSGFVRSVPGGGVRVSGGEVSKLELHFKDLVLNGRIDSGGWACIADSVDRMWGTLYSNAFDGGLWLKDIDSANLRPNGIQLIHNTVGGSLTYVNPAVRLGDAAAGASGLVENFCILPGSWLSSADVAVVDLDNAVNCTIDLTGALAVSVPLVRTGASSTRNTVRVPANLRGSTFSITADRNIVEFVGAIQEANLADVVSPVAGMRFVSGVQERGYMPVRYNATVAGWITEGEDVGEVLLPEATQPSVRARRNFVEVFAGATSISKFLNGYNGQVISIRFNSGLATLVHGTATDNIMLPGAANLTPAAGTLYSFRRSGDKWYIQS